MKINWLTGAVLAASLLLPTAAGAATNAEFRIIYDGGGQAQSPALIKGGVTYIPASQWESFGLQVSWDKKQERAEFRGFNKKVAVRMGSGQGMLDGKLVKLGGTPFKFNGELYVPARFLVQSLEGRMVSWDANHKLLVAAGMHSYSSASAQYEGLTYTIDKPSGKLYTTDSKGNTRLLANLGAEVYEYVSFDFKKTPGGLTYLTITDVFGEPHINNQWFTLVIKNGVAIRQAGVHYYQRYGDNVKMYGNHLLLTDGKTLRVIEDGTGRVTETMNLTKLGGVDDRYLIEGMDDDVLLIRPNTKGILTLIDRKTGRKIELYKQFLDAEGQEYAEVNDVPYHGDELKYLKREGHVLWFQDKNTGIKYQWDMSKFQAVK
ncbi:copper amine oxidase N-terminal domain-containing protein [Paenibacillus sp. JX-17]|uniref:Copper amine oxidase N-terminal domain-containing protein n=1 Tax=Paenibacillus lacisoli TaxID=3064525 RepID=A0ABT9CE65_9BACL|nr:copper amine oxidase N-terminal domain-containing protein [Paenibacillus sp. JX-17]MDO7907150.1 copper amine oxidase N-terminal domain-containing protein [Paenibacillus sp. JX-17]